MIHSISAFSNNSSKNHLFYGVQTQKQLNGQRSDLTHRLSRQLESTELYKYTIKLLALQIEDNKPVSERLLRKALKEHGIELIEDAFTYKSYKKEESNRRAHGIFYQERTFSFAKADGTSFSFVSRDHYWPWRHGWKENFFGQFRNTHKVPPEEARQLQQFLRQKMGLTLQA